MQMQPDNPLTLHHYADDADLGSLSACGGAFAFRRVNLKPRTGR